MDIPIEITKSGTSHGWLGYRVDSEAPQTRRKSAQTTRRACPNYNLHTCGDQGGRPYRNNQIGHFARMAWIQSRLRSTADPTEERSGDQESLPKLQLTHMATKLILRIEIAKSGTSNGRLGYRVDSEAPQTRRKSTQATRRACPNYDFHTCGDQGGRPYRNNQIGHFARMDWIQSGLRSTADPTEEHSSDQESLPKLRLTHMR